MLFWDGIHSDVCVFSLLVSFPPGHDQYLGGGGGAGGDGDGAGGDGVGGGGAGGGGGGGGDGFLLGRAVRPEIPGPCLCLFIPSTHLQLSK